VIPITKHFGYGTTPARFARFPLLTHEGKFSFLEGNMYLGKVVGNVVCSVQDESLTGRTLLLVQRLPKGPVVVAVDAVGAGLGETVYICRGKEASFPFLPAEVSTETSIVAIVDPPSP